MRAFKTNSEYLEILPYLDGPWQMDLKIHIKFCSVFPDPDASLEVYAHPWPNPKALMTIVRQTYTRTWLAFHLVNGGKMADIDALLEQAEDLIVNILGKFDDFMLWPTDCNISTHISHVFSKKFDVSLEPCPCYAFYIPEEKQEEIIKMDVQLPDGFTFCELDPEEDHQFIADTWPYSTATEAPNIKSKLEHLPSIGVKHDGRLVAFELMHHSGAMNHLYTVPEFRGRGIGTAVELRLAQKIISDGIVPYKTVAFTAPLGMSLTDKSSYWKRIVDEHTKEPIVVDYHVIRHL